MHIFLRKMTDRGALPRMRAEGGRIAKKGLTDFITECIMNILNGEAR